MAAEVAIRIERIQKYFEPDADVPVLDDVSLEVRAGEVVAVIGPSGCGKSTVLNILAGLVQPTAGRVLMTDPTMRIGYVFQHPRLLPWRTVRRNVEFGLEQLADVGKEERQKRAAQAISLVNLSGHEGKYPHQLSGGMQQRAALARGLAIAPGVFLLDEPFGALDAITRGLLQEELLGIVRRTGTTTVLVTHDIDEALLLADRVLVMSSRPGAIKAQVTLPFGPERSLDRLVAEPEYPEIRTSLRQLLREDENRVRVAT